MKRTKFWKRRSVFALFAGGLFVLAVYISPQTRGFISGYFEKRQAMEEIRALDPQDEYEFWQAMTKALRIDADHRSVYRLDGHWVVETLTANSPKTYKSWATVDVRQLAVRSFDGGSEYPSSLNASFWSYFLWKYRPHEIWLRLGAFAVGAGLVFWFGVFLLPFLAVIFLAVLLHGKSSHYADTVVHDPIGVEVLQQTDGGSGEQAEDLSPTAAIVPVLIWPIILFIAVTVRPRDCWKLLLRLTTTLRSRAPPIERKGCLMLRKAVLGLVFISLFVAPVSAGQTVNLIFGEWAVARSSAVETKFESQHWGALPFLFLDGSRFECTGYFKAGSDKNCLMAGPVFGSLNQPSGSRLTGGAEFRGCISRWESSLSWRLAARYRGSQRLFHFASVGLERSVKQISFRVSYQPIKRQAGWDQRLALRVSLPARFCRIGLEVRTSLDSHHRTTANAEVNIPLP